MLKKKWLIYRPSFHAFRIVAKRESSWMNVELSLEISRYWSMYPSYESFSFFFSFLFFFFFFPLHDTTITVNIPLEENGDSRWLNVFSEGE